MTVSSRSHRRALWSLQVSLYRKMILIAFMSSKCCGVNCACWFPSFRLINSGLQTAAASHNRPAAVLQRGRPQHRQTQKEEVQVSGGQGAQHPFQVSENAHISSYSDYYFSSVFLLTFLRVTFFFFKYVTVG